MTDPFMKAKEALLYETYKKFRGQGYLFKEEFYMNSIDPELGIESCELLKKQD